jgi:hypothetical protein
VFRKAPGDTPPIPKRTGSKATTKPQAAETAAVKPRKSKIDVCVVIGSEPAAGDTRRALDAPETNDNDGRAEQGEGAGAAGQGGRINRLLRWSKKKEDQPWRCTCHRATASRN